MVVAGTGLASACVVIDFAEDVNLGVADWLALSVDGWAVLLLILKIVGYL